MPVYSGAFNSATPGDVIRVAIRTPINAHAAWTFNETVTTANGNTDVFTCAGSVNGFGTDFVIGVVTNTTGTRISLILGESFDVVLKKFNKPAIFTLGATTNTVEADLSYLTPRHVVDETTMRTATTGWLAAIGYGLTVGPSAAVSAASAIPPTSVGGTWILSVTNQRITLSWYQDSAPASGYALGLYAGLYESFHASSVDVFPIYCGAIGCPTTGADLLPGTAGAFPGAKTRAAAAGTFSAAFMTQVTASPWTLPFGQNGTAIAGREPISNKYWPVRQVLIDASGCRVGGIWGLLKDTIVITGSGIGELPQDTITVDGISYTCIAANPQTSTGHVIMAPSAGGVSPIGTASWVPTL